MGSLIDHTVALYMDASVFDERLSDIVSGKLDDKPDGWYTKEDAFGMRNRDSLLRRIGDTESRLSSDRSILGDLILANRTPNVFTHRTMLIYMSFLRATTLRDSNGVVMDTLGTDVAELAEIESLRQRIMAGYRKKLQTGTFVDDDEILHEHLSAMSVGSGGLKTVGARREGESSDEYMQRQRAAEIGSTGFTCRILPTRVIVRIMRLNLGSAALDMLFDRERAEFLAREEMCEAMDAQARGALERIGKNGAQMMRVVVFYMKYGLALLRGFYAMSDSLYKKFSGRQNTGEFLVAMLAMYKMVNPFTVLYTVVTAVPAGSLFSLGASGAAGLSTLLLVLWLNFGAASSLSFDAAVAAGDVRGRAELDFKRGRSRKNKRRADFGKETNEMLLKQVDVFEKAQREFDKRVAAKLQKFSAQTWERAAAELPADFMQVCTVLDADKTAEVWLTEFYANESGLSRFAQRVNRSLGSVPQRFFAAFNAAVTYDDVFDSLGRKRKGDAICVAVWLRMRTENQPLFSEFLDTYAPSFSS